MLSSTQEMSPPAWCRALVAAERFLVRTFRVAAGIVPAGIAFWLFGVAFDTLGQPFASLSPLGLLGGILVGLGGLPLLGLAFGVAFGEKGESSIEAAWRRRHETTTKIQRKHLGYEE